MKLSSEERAHFEEHGYVQPMKLIEREDALAIGERVVSELLEVNSPVYSHTETDIPRLLNTRDRQIDSPLLYRIGVMPEIVDRVCGFLGPNVMLWRSDIFWQGPGDPPTPPHQDIDLSGTRNIPTIEAGEDYSGKVLGNLPHEGGEVRLPMYVSAWIALTDTNAEEGAFWVVPGTHKSIIAEVPGEAFGGRKRQMEREFSLDEGIPLAMKAGEFVLFHNLLVHGSVPATTRRRVGLNTRYAPPDALLYARGPVNAQGMDISKFGALLVAGSNDGGKNRLLAPPAIGASSLVHEKIVG